MQTYRLALIGFGNVGQGLVSILHEHGIEYAQRFGANFQVVAVSDIQKGAVYNPDGLYLAELMAIAAEGGNLDKVQGKFHGWDALKTIKDSNADVVIEMTYTNLETGQPAISHLETALKAGKHVVTTNKGPTALKYGELANLAKANHVEIGVEGTVMSGTPTVNLGMHLLAGAGIQKIQGILNGTTNYILTQMGTGAAYQDALLEAQKLGYAEADPTGDVEGFDAAGKVVILANLLMNVQIGMNDIDRTGITRLTPADISSAKDANERWKLIGKVEKTESGVQASVKPTRLPITHPLATVDGGTNAITFTTNLLGDVTLIGPGAGRLQTGYAVIVDLLEIHRKLLK
jgi:homoserine dehydrogenase